MNIFNDNVLTVSHSVSLIQTLQNLKRFSYTITCFLAVCDLIYISNFWLDLSKSCLKIYKLKFTGLNVCKTVHHTCYILCQQSSSATLIIGYKLACALYTYLWIWYFQIAKEKKLLEVDIMTKTGKTAMLWLSDKWMVSKSLYSCW